MFKEKIQHKLEQGYGRRPWFGDNVLNRITVYKVKSRVEDGNNNNKKRLLQPENSRIF